MEASAWRGLFLVQSGITGLVEVQGIDMSTPKLLAETDAEVLAPLGLRNYFWFVVLTMLKGAGDRA